MPKALTASATSNGTTTATCDLVFISYSHNDIQYRKELEKHPKSRTHWPERKSLSSLFPAVFSHRTSSGTKSSSPSSRVTIHAEGETYSLFYLSKSRDGRPQTGMSDEQWRPLAKRLWDLALRVQKETAEEKADKG